jgi:hypothetical protein
VQLVELGANSVGLESWSSASAPRFSGTEASCWLGPALAEAAGVDALHWN